MKRGLIVFAREPLPGTVKTRLAASVGDQAAAQLYESMLQDVLKTCRGQDDGETVIFWACEEDSLQRLAERYGFVSRRQRPGDLGQRMQSAFAEMFGDGCELCCIIGSDAPDLPFSYIQEAYRLLETEQTDIVFGPSVDGGYYLLGMKRVWPQLFTDISWSSADVLEQSLTAARDSGASVALLPEWHDIDTIEDLWAFQGRQRMAYAMETI